jgi:hypothetical protein
MSSSESWNRCAYVLNNPLAAIDPDRLWCVWEDGTHDLDEEDGGDSKSDCVSAGGYWDPFDTITGIFQQNGIVTQINSIGGVCTTADCGAGGTLEQFAQTLSTYSVAANSNSSLGVFAGNLFSPGNFVQTFKNDWNGRYFGCVFSGGSDESSSRAVGTAVVEKTAETAVTSETAATPGARIWLGLTDARFTAWGRYSKVLVPRLAGKIGVFLKAADVAGWALTDAELAKGLVKCTPPPGS